MCVCVCVYMYVCVCVIVYYMYAVTAATMDNKWADSDNSAKKYAGPLSRVQDLLNWALGINRQVVLND